MKIDVVTLILSQNLRSNHNNILQYSSIWTNWYDLCTIKLVYMSMSGHKTLTKINWQPSPNNFYIVKYFYCSVPGFNSISRRVPPSSLVLGQQGPAGYEDDLIGVNTRLGLPLCDGINVNPNRASLRTPLLEDDRESCVWTIVIITVEKWNYFNLELHILSSMLGIFPILYVTLKAIQFK